MRWFFKYWIDIVNMFIVGRFFLEIFFNLELCCMFYNKYSKKKFDMLN